jgi:LmbE family N-acetylglucosaminyl deacetylase
MKKVVVLCAHPDDEVLGCGGWIAKLARHEHQVSVIFTTDGVRHPPASKDNRADAFEALALLSVQPDDVRFLGLPMMRSDGQVLRDFTPEVEELVTDADLLIVPSKDDLNVDHVFAYNLGLICCRPIRRQVNIVSMEILSSSEWGDQPFQPNFYVDISETLDLKIAALTRYTHEIRQFPHPRSPEALRIKAQQRGLEVGYRYAEAFKVIRWFGE